jgi:aspartate kinase
MKFGGTSVGSAERMRVAARISAEQRQKRPTLVVVSAMSKVTDLLIDSMRHAEGGDIAGLEGNLRILEQRHVQTCRELLPEERQPAALAAVDEMVSAFRRITQGMLMLNDRPSRSVDEALAIGERLSAMLVAAFLESEGIPAVAVNAAGVIVTDAVYGNASPVMEATREKARRTLAPLAAALDAAELWIWTDVDGIMTADPRLAPEARVLSEVTYSEAAELAYNGAKVLHPRTLAPLADREIPVWSKNSFALDKPGTKIVPKIQASSGARAVTSTAKVALISMEPSSVSLMGAQIMGRALDALARANVEVLALSSSSFRQSFCVLVRSEELRAAIQGLETALALELAHGYLSPIDVDEDVGLLAVVGEGMRGTPGLAGRIFTAISRANVNIIAIAQGSSELTISIIVRRDGLEKAVRAVHHECGMGATPSVVLP